jgi:xanthosine utilization system XapX-like protein
MKTYLSSVIFGCLGICVGFAFSLIHAPSKPQPQITAAHSLGDSLSGSDLVRLADNGGFVVVWSHGKPYASNFQPLTAHIEAGRTIYTFHD